ncbi:MAG: Gfo/Idh/MocA family oxidoreductase [Lentisphaeria bacterium]|nr:Gfo/Idh/MocA family oxidoreductase [Lentisphaeria bacterium]
MSEKTKLGVVGCGGFCRGNHIPNLLKNPAVDLKTLCDLNTDGLEQFNVRRITTDMEELFADPEIRGVVCATKPDARRDIMALALKYRKPLFVEKPLCWGEEETLKTVDMMKEFRDFLFVGFNRQFSPLMKDAYELFKKHCGGTATTIIYRIVGEALIWPPAHYDAVINKKESTIIHEVTHIFQLLHFLTGNFPVSVHTAGGGNVDNIITLEYPGNVTAVIIAGDNGSVGFPKEYLEINGNYTTIAGYNFTELEITACKLFERRRYPYTIAGREYTTSHVEMEEKLRAFRSSITPEEQSVGYYYDRQVHVDKGHAQEMEVFRQLAAGEIRRSPIDLYAGAAANLIACEALRSHTEKRKIFPDLNKLFRNS